MSDEIEYIDEETLQQLILSEVELTKHRIESGENSFKQITNLLLTVKELSRPHRRLRVLNLVDKVKEAAREIGRTDIADDETFTHAIATCVLNTETGDNAYLMIAVGGQAEDGATRPLMPSWADEDGISDWLDDVLTKALAEEGISFERDKLRDFIVDADSDLRIPVGHLGDEFKAATPNYSEEEISKFRDELDELYPSYEGDDQ